MKGNELIASSISSDIRSENKLGIGCGPRPETQFCKILRI